MKSHGENLNRTPFPITQQPGASVPVTFVGVATGVRLAPGVVAVLVAVTGRTVAVAVGVPVSACAVCVLQATSVFQLAAAGTQGGGADWGAFKTTAVLIAMTSK